MTSHTTSHWQATHPAPTLDPSIPKAADAVVIGGGMTGVSAAYWLARLGARVVLVEQTSLAAGATGRNGGFLTVGAASSYPSAINTLGHTAAKAIWQLTYTNRDLVREVLAQEHIDCDYREPGTLHLLLSAQEMAEARTAVDALNTDGFAHELLDQPQTQQLIGTQLGDEIVGATLLPNGGLLHSAKLVTGIANAAQRHGATLAQASVTGVHAAGDGVIVRTDRGELAARGLVVAANAWTHALVPAVRDFIRPVRGQVLSFAPIAPVFSHGMGAEITPTGEYWQQTPDGSIVFGGCRAVRPDGDVNIIDDGLSDDVQAALEAAVVQLFPALDGQLRVVRRWSGPMAFTPDYLPVLDAVPNLPNAWFAGGYCGHGMPFGMIFGKRMAEAVLSGSLAEKHFRMRG